MRSKQNKKIDMKDQDHAVNAIIGICIGINLAVWLIVVIQMFQS
jgi:tetrahydromethanopterin S-methyltransferase subunit F